MEIQYKELADFLEEANKSTYANKNAPKAIPSRPKSEDYHTMRMMAGDIQTQRKAT